MAAAAADGSLGCLTDYLSYQVSKASADQRAAVAAESGSCESYRPRIRRRAYQRDLR
jgi:hypothetical protein